MLFMGTPDFAAIIFDILLNRGYSFSGVFCQPPRPKGRGYAMTKSPVHLLAESRGIKVFTPTTLRDPEIHNQIKSMAPSHIIVAAYGLLLPQAILDIPPGGCLNVHGSLLPRWRGAAPIHHAIMAGDEETGPTIMMMDAGMDTGPVMAMKRFPISMDDTLTTLTQRMAHEGGQLLADVLDYPDDYPPMRQSDVGITMAPKITKTMGALDLNQPADILIRHIRALNPWPGTWFSWTGLDIKIIDAYVVQDHLPDCAPGTPWVQDGQIFLTAGSGTSLGIRVLQLAGKRPMTSDEFLRGHPSFFDKNFLA